MQIHVETDILRSSGTQLLMRVDEIQEMLAELRRAEARLEMDWQGGRRQREICAELRRVTRRMQRQMQELELLSAIMRRTADRWEEEDATWQQIHRQVNTQTPTENG